MRKRGLVPAGAAAAALLACALAGLAQRGRFRDSPEADYTPDFPKNAEFHFIRVEYTDLPGFSRGFRNVSRNGRANGWWAQDWPDADNHFTEGVGRLTRINVGDPRHVVVTDDFWGDYEWQYFQETMQRVLPNQPIPDIQET